MFDFDTNSNPKGVEVRAQDTRGKLESLMNDVSHVKRVVQDL